jgi:hypothetical protein
VNNYQRGDLTGVSWQPQAVGIPPILLTVRDQDLDVMSLLYDTTNRLSQGVRSRLAGPTDAAATILAVHDADQPAYLAAGGFIQQGQGGLLLFFITITSIFIQVPMRIEKVHWKSGTETEVMYSFDAKCDSRVGTLIWPAQ